MTNKHDTFDAEDKYATQHIERYQLSEDSILSYGDAKSKYLKICDVIKQNESELANIDLEIEPNKGKKSFCFLLF